MLQLGVNSKGSGAAGEWGSESHPVIVGQRDVIQPSGILGLYSQLDKITAARLQLLKMMEPAQDRSIESNLVMVVINDRVERDQIQSIMDAQSFRNLAAPELAE